MEGLVSDHEKRLSRIEGMLDSLDKRLDEALFTQIKDHARRIRDLEDRIARMAESCAAERGKLEGGKTALMGVMAVISSTGGLVGAMISRLF